MTTFLSDCRGYILRAHVPFRQMRACFLTVLLFSWVICAGAQAPESAKGAGSDRKAATPVRTPALSDDENLKPPELTPARESSRKSSSSRKGSSSRTPTPTPTPEPTPTPTPAPTPTPTPEPAPTPAMGTVPTTPSLFPSSDLRGLSSATMVTRDLVPTPQKTPAVAAIPVPSKTASGLGGTPREEEKKSDKKSWFSNFSLDQLIVPGAALGVIALVWWFLRVMSALSRRKHYRDAQVDDQPSVDERLLSELAPMEVVLLRGSITGFYEKSYLLMNQVLIARKLLDVRRKNTEEILERLRNLGVEPAYFDCVESIARRCDVVLYEGAEPNYPAHKTMIKDLETLIRMKANALGRRRERKPMTGEAEAPRPRMGLFRSNSDTPPPSDDSNNQ